MLCREQAVQLHRASGPFREAGAALTTVGQGTPEQARQFADGLDVEFPVLADPGRIAYSAYSLVEGGLGEFLNPASLRSYGRALIRRAGAGRIVGNARQLPGAFVIDRAGIIQYAKPATHPADTPSPAELLAAVAANS